MSIDKLFKDHVTESCYSALAHVGFERYRKYNLDWPLHDGFHCWVGLNRGIYPTHVEINPFVGLHVVPLMRLAESLAGRKYNRGVATYAVHFGLLAPSTRGFVFDKHSDVVAEAHRLANLYLGEGLSYAKALASYDALLPLLHARAESLGGYPECVACCLYLMGKGDEAAQFVDSFFAKEPKYFMTFAQAFSELRAKQPDVRVLANEWSDRRPTITVV